MTTYSDEWDTFIHSISKTRIAALRRQLDLDPKIALIIALASNWDPTGLAKDHARRAQLHQRRALEAHLLELEAASPTLDVAALRDYALEGHQAPAKTHTRTDSEIRADARRAAKFWTRADAGWVGHRRVTQVVAEHLDLSSASWLATHPYGDPTPDDRLQALRREMRASRPPRRPDDAVRPVGMTYERALQIAKRVLENRGGAW